MAQLERYAQDAGEHGPSTCSSSAPPRFDPTLPWLGTEVVGASLCAEDGQANPRLVGPAFARLARRLGADVREHAAVISAARSGDGFDDPQRAHRGAAAASSSIARASAPARSPPASARPCRCGRSCRTCSSPSRCRSSSTARSASAAAACTCARSRAATPSSAAATAGATPTAPARGRRRRRRSRRWRARRRSFPRLAGSLVIRTWAGIDGEMPDRIPVIGFSATTPNLVHAFGFSGHGFQLGPVVGEIIAELVTRRPLRVGARAVRDRALRGRGSGGALRPSAPANDSWQSRGLDASSAGYDAARRLPARS